MSIEVTTTLPDVVMPGSIGPDCTGAVGSLVTSVTIVVTTDSIVVVVTGTPLAGGVGNGAG